MANAIAFTPDSRQVVAGLSNGSIRMWSSENGKVLRTLSGHQYAVRAIALDPEGQRLASASSDQTIKLWNLKTGQVIQSLRLQPTDGIVDTLQISSDGKRLASATTQNKLQLWDISTGRLVRTFVDESVNLNYRLPVQFSPNGQQLATADIRWVVYTINAIEPLNCSLRKVLKTKGSFPDDDSVLKLLYLALRNIAKKWTMPIKDWRAALNRFAIEFPERFPY